MCGVAGCVGPRGSEPLVADPDVLRHRGPDRYDAWLGDGVALQHWRLSIIDVSDTGRQPMTSASGRYTIVYNGEIYNYPELRRQLERAGVRFRGGSDTEVLIEALDRWGIERTLRRVEGMFAFALWDAHERTITLARDRFGEKPMYYAWCDGQFVFASELKALRSLPAFDPPVDRDVLSLFLLVNYVPEPYSIYQDVAKLEPGHYVTVEADRPGAIIVPVSYWSSLEAASKAMANPFLGTFTDAVDELEDRCREVIRSRMLSDVPLGAFLSGGIDSSLIVALMAEQSARPVSTFAIGFTEEHMNEAPYAAQVARHLGTEHHEWIVTGADALDVVPRLATMFDEPLADYSQIPTYLVSEFARSQVTVALSGDGGDEIFGGYSRYLFSEGSLKRLGRLPRPMRAGFAGLLGVPEPAQWERLRPLIERVRPGSVGVGHLGDRVQRLRDALAQDAPLGAYRGLMSYWDPSPVLTDAAGPSRRGVDGPFDRRRLVLCSPTEEMMELDVATYLPGDILCKVDRAAMAVSLETRAPFLDHELYAFAWSLPLSMRVDRTAGKKVLRQVLHRHVPIDLVERRKTPFGAPLAEWLRGPLRAWAEDLLTERRLRDDGYLDTATVRARWREHLSGERNWQHHLWGVLMFNAFLDRWKPPAS